MHGRLVALLATMEISVLPVAGIASADPVNGKNVRVFDFDCGGEEVSVATIFHN
jgi:hypothetical protein